MLNAIVLNVIMLNVVVPTHQPLKVEKNNHKFEIIGILEFLLYA
jgi:hypothetical protein